jgi:hypothetical protein
MMIIETRNSLSLSLSLSLSFFVSLTLIHLAHRERKKEEEEADCVANELHMCCFDWFASLVRCFKSESQEHT